MRKPTRSDVPPKNGAASAPPSSGSRSQRVCELDASRLLHELRVHQFELEVQNEELRRARSEMEIALRLYTEIFDFSPIGYVTLQSDHVILNANLAAGEMLARPRSILNGMTFERLVTYASREAFSHLIREAWSSGEKQTCQLGLLIGGGRTLRARVSAVPLLRTQPTLLLTIEASGARPDQS